MAGYEITSTASTRTWYYWNYDYTTTTASSTGIVWRYWNSTADATYSTTSAASADVWVDWNNGYRITWTRPEPETAEQRQRREAAEREQREAAERRRQEQQREREAAEQKAKELLVSNLDEEQRESYEKTRQFVVHSKDGQRKYRIKHGRAGNVELLNEEGKPVKRFCAHPRLDVPDADTVLAQKLMLEHDEDRFLKIANVTPLVA